LPQTRRSNGIDKPLQSLAGFSGKSFDYEYDYVDDFIDQKGVPYSSTRRNDLKYGPWEQVGNPGAGVMGRRAVSAISSDAMPGMRFRKASDEDMYWDDEDEVAIEPDAESKVDMTPEQAAGLRAAGEYFSGRSGSRASADTMEARGRNRIRQFRNWQGSEGRRPANKPTAPKPASSTLSSVTKRPSGVGGSADTMSRQIANRPNRPNTRFSNSSGNNRQRTWSGSPGGNAPRPRPAVKPPTKPSSSGGRSLGEKLTYIPSKLWHELGPHL
jgi:hypothetical protein